MKDLLKAFDSSKVGFFRFRELDGRYIITNDIGDFAILSKEEFEQLLSGKLSKTHPNYSVLVQGGFIREDSPADDKKEGESSDCHSASLHSRWLSKNSFLFSGPSLHIVVLTRRCNLSCVYCHAGANPAAGTDMDIETARKTVNAIFKTPSPSFNIEFQGGEPLLNWPVLQYIVEAAEKKAKKTGKKIVMSVVTNLTAMTDEKLDYLIAHSVNICTSLDGCRDLHNANRKFAKGEGDSYSFVSKWLRTIKEKGSAKGYAGDALLTVTRKSLSMPEQIVDEYVSQGMKYIFIRFLNPFGAAKKAWKEIGYTAEEYLEFYKKALDYILSLVRGGKTDITEHTARLLLQKILGSSDPNFLDLRSPCGAGIGQIAYNYDGNVYTCDEGRMLAAMGDVSFCMGDVKKDSYSKMMNSPVVKCMTTASLSDLQPLCSDCAYKPYCGVCPVFNYSEHGDLFMYGANYRCKIYKGIIDYLFILMEDQENRKIFNKWAASGSEGK